ncbi:hypothetical protein PR048_029198 [Dryococelus australis]|uniref:Transposase n=1 Tax=Dryococelus australis TaxID=614101 RepID=A0ABQ9GCN9_9NEOP|nr:hypothetical protein PR048_029198 [Dryococelus australis]
MEGSEKKKKVRYMCVNLTKWEESCIWLRPGKTHKHKVYYCSLCKREFSIAHGGSKDCKQHASTAGHKNNERDLNQSLKINSFFSNATMSASKILAGDLSLYHMVKHSCGRTKAEAIVKNVLAPKSVKDFVDILSNEDNTRKFFSLATEASTYKNCKMFPVVVRYFDPCGGIQNKLLDFIEQSHIEAVSSINGSDLRNVSFYCADNAFVNYGKHHSVMTLLKRGNENMLKANCSNHVLHNSCKRVCESFRIDIKVFVLKLYGHFACSEKRREVLKYLFELVDLKWCEILRHVPTRWLSLTPAVNHFVNNWEAIKSYIKSTDDCPKAVQCFSDDPEKELIIEAYLGLFSHIGNILLQTSKYVETADLSIMETFNVIRTVLDKVPERNNDRFFGSITQRILNLTCQIILFFPCALAEINFNEINNSVTLFKIKVDVDTLYDEFCNAKEILKSKINAQATSTYGISVPNLEKLLCFVMSIPDSNTHTERVFSLMNCKLNKTSVELMKAELQVVVNLKYSYKKIL